MSGDKETLTPVLGDQEREEQAARLALMQRVVRLLADNEDTKGRGIGWDEILVRSRVNAVILKRCLGDLEALKYLVRNTETGAEENSGDVSIRTLRERYGTTFFGRKWLSEQ